MNVTCSFVTKINKRSGEDEVGHRDVYYVFGLTLQLYLEQCLLGLGAEVCL
jgi:hypothetical protein